MKNAQLYTLKFTKLIILFYLFFMNLSTAESQKCLTYGLNLNKIEYNSKLNNVDSVCSTSNKNENSYCEVILSSCFCRKNYYGENCEKIIQELKMVKSGISTGDFTLLILILLIIFPSMLIFGLFIIFFLCKDNANNSNEKTFKGAYTKRTKISNINFNNNENQNVIIKNDIEKKINSENNADNDNIDFSQQKTDNTNILLKREFNIVNNITENNITDNDDKFKYSQIPLSTERKDDNLLITIRNNTENDNDTYAYKRPGIQNLNRTTAEDYAKKFDEIEEFISQFKTSLQENFNENENFMNFIEDIFTNIENYINERDYDIKNRSAIKKIKTELQKLFNKLNGNVFNGKNYIKANNFYQIYQVIFNIIDETNIIEENNYNENYDMKKRNNFEISFNNDISAAYNKDINLNQNNIKFEVTESNRNFLHTETSYLGADTSNNEIIENKMKPPKKNFAIKSVEISKSPLIGKKKDDKNVESTNNVKTQNQIIESNQSNSNKI